MAKLIEYKPRVKRQIKPASKSRTRPFETEVQQYDQWFDKHSFAYLSELYAVGNLLPKDGVGIEVGLATGRFAGPCGIKEGVEPSRVMGELAAKRGFEVINGTAENLPYKDMRHDFILMVTICYFNDVQKAFEEAYRVLKRNGTLVVGFIDKYRTIGKEYAERKGEGGYYDYATFYTPQEVQKMLKAANFHIEETKQTLFGRLNEINDLQDTKEGYGEGSFVIIKAVKNK